MKKVRIKYNPYLLKTEIEIDGKPLKPNSKLHFGNLRIQEWATQLPQILIAETSDKNFDIEFIGTKNDYNDLKTAIEESGDISVSLHPLFQSSVSEVEAKIEDIFNEIQAGPVAQLKDRTITEAFEKAKNQEFEINVVATMSSGKSTLINALLDKKLMPVANMATTATIVRIIDTDMPEEHDEKGKKIKRFDAVAYNAQGKKIKEQENITYRMMRDWNSDSSISSIDIKGEIPCASSIDMKLVLVDTPGPNNSEDERHRKMTYQMLEDSDKSLVLFVMNARQLNIDDQKNFMDYVCKCMKEGGKQSRERYIFAINQMDGYDPEDEEPEDALKSAKKVLEDYHITSPNLFPVSALAALECRTNPEIKTALPVFGPRVKRFPEMKFDSYYEYNHLPLSSRNNIEKMLSECKSDEERLQIHSGIISIEEAISLYIDKYARALKVKDLVDSFNNRLKELNAIAFLKESVRNNENKKAELENRIKKIKEQINSANSAKELTAIIEEQNLSGSVGKEIVDFIEGTQNKINRIILSFNNKNQVRKSEAERQIAEIKRESDDIIAQLDSRISSILERGFEILYTTIINRYKNYVQELGMNLGGSNLSLRPLDFVAENIANLNSILKNNTKIVDEGHNETRTVREAYQHKLRNSFFKPWQYFTKRYETRYRDKKVTEWIPNNVEYIDMKKVVSQFLSPLQSLILDAQRAAMEHANTESVRIKTSLRNYLQDINKALERKLNELSSATNSFAQTEKEIQKQKENLRWMSGIIERINKLIEF